MTSRISRASANRIVDKLLLEPLPVEGGLFVQTWKSCARNEILGTATYAAFTDDPDSFSAIHQLPVDEIWHFYLGDPVELLLLQSDGSWSAPVLGHDILNGQHPQLIVKAGDWVGGRLAPGGLFGLFGNTMAPGFDSSSYLGGQLESLCQRWPTAADQIAALVRPGGSLTMPSGY